VKGRDEILLVACYELGHQPLAVAWPAAFLERAGYQPAVMDVAVEPFDADRVRRARLVAVSVPMHTALRIGMDVARQVRAVNPSAHVCFFGLYATLNAAYLHAHGVDSVIAGEAEQALVTLAASLEHGELGSLPGVGVARGHAAPVLERLDFPVPSRSALPALKKYVRLERDGGQEMAGAVEATRGCRHLCRHCPIPPVYGGRFFAVPIDIVLADVRQLVEAGATHVTFADPDFLNGPTHALRAARAVHSEFPQVTFDFTAKIEHLVRDARHLGEFRDLGCAFIVSAVESLSDTVLSHLAKGHARRDVDHALGATRRAGIPLRPTWVPFTPWTTLGDYREILDFVADEALVDHVDPVQYSIRLLVPPGSLLATAEAMRPHIAALVPEDFAYHWRHPDPGMDALHEQITALVADAAQRGEDAAVTFERIRAVADTAAGAAPRRMPVVPVERQRPPRLSEPWFC
jgi:radical SAM superfamily enzyme YgiQ (UPF0313 family)